MQIRSVMMSYCLQQKSGKILNKRYLWKYSNSVLKTWHHKCESQKKQNETLAIGIYKIINSKNSIRLLLTGSSTSSSSDMNKFDGDRSGVSGSNNSSGDWFPDSSPAGC